MQNFVYPVTLIPDADDGGFVVKFADFPEAITQGDTEEEALREAVDCLEEAVANRMAMNLPIPEPLPFSEGAISAPAGFVTRRNKRRVTNPPRAVVVRPKLQRCYIASEHASNA